MSRPRRVAEGTEPLFAEPVAQPGPMQQAVLDALARRRHDDVDDDLVLQQLAVALACALDHANGSRDPYAASQPARELRETWQRLVGPGEGVKPRDAFADFLDGLADDGTAAPVRDAAHSE